jgi:hypothetical protein
MHSMKRNCIFSVGLVIISIKYVKMATWAGQGDESPPELGSPTPDALAPTGWRD